MAIRLLPTIPHRTDDPDTFIANADAWMTALPVLVDDMNVTAANMTAIAAGGAFSIPYTFDTSTANADPGIGRLRFSSASQSSVSQMYADNLGQDNSDWSPLYDTIQAGTSAVKGSLKVTKLGDTSKWLVFNISGISNPGGYRNIQGVVVAASSANPFANGDTLVMQLQRTGDVGSPGTLVRRVQTVVNTNGPVVSMDVYDMYVMTAAAQSLTLNAPTGTLADGRQLMYRIKDNGTAQAIAYNAVYRASAELPFPPTTAPGKWLYLGFVYNATDAKWDLIASISAI